MHTQNEEPRMSAEWTVQLTLLGRRDGAPIAGVGSEAFRGSFSSYTAAREAVGTWERHEEFIYRARAYHRGEQ